MRSLRIKRLALAIAVLNCLAFPLWAAQNKAPVANNDNYSVNTNTTLTMAAPGVLANDTDQNGDPLTRSNTRQQAISAPRTLLFTRPTTAKQILASPA